MPWKTPTNCEVPYAVQDKGKECISEEGQEVDGTEEPPNEEESDSASESA